MDFKSPILLLLMTLTAVTLASPQTNINRAQNQPDSFTRIKRQDASSTTTPPPKRRPQNLFSLFSTLLRETRDDARRAFSEIGKMFNSQFTPSPPKPTTVKPNTNSTSTGNGDDTSTTTEPYRISRNEFNGIIRSNLVGIGRLFGKELRNAISDSGKNLRQFGSEFRTQIRPYVEIRNGNRTITNQ